MTSSDKTMTGASPSVSVQGRKAIRAAVVGFFVDTFDVFLPVLALAPANQYFIPASLSPGTKTVLSSLVFVSTLLARPAGAMLFGRQADKIGRKKMATISLTTFGLATLAIAVLPGYETLGLGALAALLALRFIAGLFIGGGYSSANPLAMEYSPKRKRGLYGGMIQAGYPVAYLVLSLLTFLMLSLLPAGGIDTPYVQWGWRIAFVIGAALALGLGFYFRRFVEESEQFNREGGDESPLKTIFGKERWTICQVFVLTSGFWLATDTASAIIPNVLVSDIGLSHIEVTVVLSVAYAVLTGGFVASGAVSQYLGRRRTLLIEGALIVLVCAPLYSLFVASPPTNIAVVMVFASVIVLLASWHFGMATCYITERFRTGIRSSGFGLGYSLAIIPGSFYAFYQEGLSSIMPMKYTGSVLLVIGGVLIIVGAAWGPETKDVEFT